MELGAKIPIEKFICRVVLCGNFVLTLVTDESVEKIAQLCENSTRLAPSLYTHLIFDRVADLHILNGSNPCKGCLHTAPTSGFWGP